MQIYRSNGVVLEVKNFEETDQIISVFTENEGLVKFFVKKAHLMKNRLKTTPLTLGEFVYVKGKSELYRLNEISIQNHYLDLRKDLKKLELGCIFLNLILKSQMIGKPAPLLFHLLVRYLDKIKVFEDLIPLEASFRIKLLQYEGLFSLDEANLFDPYEKELLHLLLFSPSFTHLKTLSVSAELHEKIKILFDEQFSY